MEREIKFTPLYYDEAFQKKYDAIIHIGGRKSAKSFNSEVEDVAELGGKKDFKLLIIQDMEKNMSQGYYAGMVDKIDLFGHRPVYRCITSPPTITNVLNNNKALFMGYKSKDQKKAVKALDQVTKIVVEEGEWLTYEDFIALLHQLRGKVIEDRRLIILMNPVDEYCFVNEMFIQTVPDKILHYFPGTKRPKVFEKHITTTFEYEGKPQTVTVKVLIILSTHHDNPYLTMQDRANIEVLRETDSELYKQLGEARFIKSGGTYFHEFSREVHVCESFVIPDDWRRYFVMDYGLDMLAGYWVAVNNQGKAFFYKEIYESDLIVSDAATKIKDMTYEKIYDYLAPPDVMRIRHKDTGHTTAELFQDFGISLTETGNRRIDGWLNLKEWLKPYEDEQGMLTANVQITDNCVNLIRTMSQVKKDEKHPNDVAAKPHELTHAPDAMRYFFDGRPSPYVAKIKGKGKKLIDKHKPKSKVFY